MRTLRRNGRWTEAEFHAAYPMLSTAGAGRYAAKQITKAILHLAASAFTAATDRVLSRAVSEQIQSTNPSLLSSSVAQAFRRLAKRGLVGATASPNGVELQLRRAGRVRLDQLYLADLELPERPRAWDGEWRVVFFDVPEERKALRTVFRRKLQTLGFKYLQRSVWIYPYPCETVLTDLADRLQLGAHIHVAVVRSLSSDALARRHFFLKEAGEVVAEWASRDAMTLETTVPVAARTPSPITAPTDDTIELLPIDELS